MIPFLSSSYLGIWMLIKRHIPKCVNSQLILAQAADFFSMPIETVQASYQDYQSFYRSGNYRKTLGERNTLTYIESFLIYLAISTKKPQQVMEIGTSQGRSTRIINDILKAYNLYKPLVCFDIKDSLKFVLHNEVNLVITDITGHVTESALNVYQPDLIFLDAHPYHLLHSVISEFLEWSKSQQSLLIIHDCSSFFYSTRMMISKEDIQAISNRTGVWERHVLSDIFKVPEKSVDKLQTETHMLRVFPTTYGLALLFSKGKTNPEL